MILSVLEKNLAPFDQEKTGEFIRRALSEVGRVEYLLRSLKNFSLFENPMIQKTSLPSFLDRFLSLTGEDLAQKGIQVALDSGQGVTWVLTDPRALQQVMLNLLKNSADALAGGDDPRITIRVRKPVVLVHIDMIDNGCGMTEAQQRDLFKPFHT